MTATTAILVALRHEIPMLFVGDQTDAAGTTNLAATLILVGATFFVTDGVQGIAAGALRGFNDTRVPMLFAALSFWLIGFPSAYGLAFAAGLGAIGIWIGFSIAVGTFAVLLVWRFHRLSEDGRRLLDAL